VSASPELFLARRGSTVWTRPIKGTRPRGRGAELLSSPKDAAEHVMIVDLERNDLSRVCVPGSVRWPALMVAEPLAGVEHLVSTVEGELRPDVGLAELLRALFPGGSITGAPKIAAVDLIAALEPVGRGASMGALGRVYGNGDLELALTIRTFAVAGGRIHLWVGGGIVWDSDPVAEVEESLTKAVPLLEAIGAPLAEHGGGGSTAGARPTSPRRDTLAWGRR
jgi:anthranilate/para-aminobenzoate synthase component I